MLETQILTLQLALSVGIWWPSEFNAQNTKAMQRDIDHWRRIAPWGTILGVFNIKYILHTSVKGQVLMDLMAEIIEPPSDEMTEA